MRALLTGVVAMLICLGPNLAIAGDGVGNKPAENKPAGPPPDGSGSRPGDPIEPLPGDPDTDGPSRDPWRFPWQFPEHETPSPSPEQDEITLPADPESRHGPRFRRVARGYLTQDNPQEAVRILDRFLQNVPNDAETLATRAQARLVQGVDIPGAISDANKASALDSQSPFVRDMAAFARTYERKIKGIAKASMARNVMPAGLEHAGAAAEAQQVSRTPTVMGGTPPLAQRGLFYEAQSKMAVGDLRGAFDILNRAIDRDPKESRLYVLRAGVLNRLGNHPGALLDADAALARDPGNAEALRERAYANLKLGNYQLALVEVGKAIELDPSNALGYVYRAMAYEKLSDMAAALENYKKAAALDPRMSQYLDDFLARANPRQQPSEKRFLTGWRLSAGIAATLLFLLGFRGIARRAAGIVTTRGPVPVPARVAPGALGEGSVVAGNFKIVSVLGRGGMGTVYEAVDLALDRRVALKRMTVPDPSPEYAERFLKEAKLVARLSHPNLVQIFTVAEEGGEPYLVFEYVKGRTLDTVLAERGKFGPDECLAVLRDLCAGLEYAHGERIIHRDLKPSNVMVSSAGQYKVMDFGIAHQARTNSVQTQTAAWGTPPYMAPEQEMGAVSSVSDLYSLGVMTYEMMTGRRPFEGSWTHNDKLNRRFIAAADANPALPSAVNAFLNKALDPDPAKRFRTAGEFLSVLENAIGTPAGSVAEKETG